MTFSPRFDASAFAHRLRIQKRRRRRDCLNVAPVSDRVPQVSKRSRVAKTQEWYLLSKKHNDAVPPIAEDVVAPCLGVAADVGPRLAGRVAEAVREATTL